MSQAARRRLAGAALLSCALGACAAPPPAGRQSRLDQDAAVACRQRQDQIYAQQNRRELFIGDDQRDTPFSANYVSGNTARGLGDEHSRDDQYAGCVRLNEADGPDGRPSALTPPSPPPPGPR